MKVEIKNNEGFIKFMATDSGIKVDYGYNIGRTLQMAAEGSITDEQAAQYITVVALVAGTATMLREDMDTFVGMGMEAIEDGFLENQDVMLSNFDGLTEEDMELAFMTPEGNA